MLETAVYGFIGGVLSEFSGVYDLRRHDPKNWPHYMRLWTYWALGLAMAFVGAVLTLVYTRSGSDLSPILAINVGASAPLILRQLKRSTGRVDPGTID